MFFGTWGEPRRLKLFYKLEMGDTEMEAVPGKALQGPVHFQYLALAILPVRNERICKN